MAERTQQLVQKLNEFISKVSDQNISEALVAVKEAFERSEPHLNHAEWEREFDATVATSVSHITGLVDEVEDFVDTFSWIFSAEEELLETFNTIQQFLGGFPTQIPDLLRDFSDEVCNRLEKHLSLLRPEVQFTEAAEGWVRASFSPESFEHNYQIGGSCYGVGKDILYPYRGLERFIRDAVRKEL
ncbi:hypothetical protein L6164_012945 [Bauhinia variegata]|uniref:Uncharacterized protein n=1 Tax=Bauhinia variegata TaxID=167791 RepID=A0ACB9PED6_BAUVA|nr:hypothetical protein L6164_012945 [Bauhinia variegata]